MNSKRSSKCDRFSVGYIIIALMVIVAVVFILGTSATSKSKLSAGKIQFLKFLYPEFGPALPSLSLNATDNTTVTVRPEKNTSIASSASNVFVSVLTTPVLHSKRLSYQLMTWIPTFNPSQVSTAYSVQSMIPYNFVVKNQSDNGMHVWS